MLIRTQKGLSLIELMIGLLVGAIVVAGAIKIFTGSAKNSSDNIKLSMLNQDLRVMMDIMVRDIRRAGYRYNASITNAPAFLNTIRHNPFTEINIEASDPCITYLYDKNTATPSIIDSSERMGFRLKNDLLQMRRTSTALPCANGIWESITTPKVKITQLTFTLDPDPPVLLNITQKKLHPTSAVVTCNVGDECLIIRNIKIGLTGELEEDATTTQTLTETVRVRNDQYCKIGSLSPRTCI
ncbi:MAG: prepilin-type N-terminal cleavage/methylation domain-containing protein [Methylococcaceae bacterium]|nr:prepilin-type N-terminal cleavage/methylation domain-containing protein [Methylococcaceae bacterium]